MSISILVILGLVLVNALYVAAEFSVVALRRSQVAQLAEQGNRHAQGLLPMLADGAQLDRFVAACQIGITLSSLVAGAYGQAALTPALGPLLERFGLAPLTALSAAAVVVLVVLTAVQVVMGELIPKSLALQMPVRVALLTFVPMRWSLRLYTWFIDVLNGSALVLLKPFGVTPTGHGHIHTADEIDLLLKESQEQGAMAMEKRDALRRALKMSARPARQIMVPWIDVEAVDLDTPPDEILARAASSPYTRLPVYKGSHDKVVGVVHTKDLVACHAEGRPPPPLSTLLRRVPFVPENLAADRLLQVLREKRCAMAVVVNEFGGMVGIATVGDVIGSLLGDMGDELKTLDIPTPERLPDGRLRMPGDLPLADADRWMGVEWESRAATVGGHVIYRLGRLPAAGERLVVDGVEVEVEDTDGRTVKTLLVGAPGGGAEAADG